MATQKQREEIFEHWNSKKIIVHKRMNQQMHQVVDSALKTYTTEELKEIIDVYAEILEPGKSFPEKKYFWTYKWNLYEFMRRGLNSLDGKKPEDYLKHPPQGYEGQTKALVFGRKNKNKK